MSRTPPAPTRSLLQYGVSQGLARWRAAHYRDLRYSIRLNLEPGAASIRGSITLQMRFASAPVDLVLDWRGAAEAVSELRVDGGNVTRARIARGHLIVPARLLCRGENCVTLDFETPVGSAGTAVLRYRDSGDGAEYLYTLLVPAGATFLREEAVLFPSTPDILDRFRRAQLVLHETSHQWFGDLVTMRWFDDLWLKEGFANFMAAKAADALLGEQHPQAGAWIGFHALKTAAYRTDATRGTTALLQPLPNLASAKSAYGNIVYSKGPAVLRQAEFYLGETVFRRGVRALEAASGRTLGR